MELKTRIKDLKTGDTFRMREVFFRVTEITETKVVFYGLQRNSEAIYGYAFSRGRKSKEFVWRISTLKIERPKAEYSNIGYWEMSQAI